MDQEYKSLKNKHFVMMDEKLKIKEEPWQYVRACERQENALETTSTSWSYQTPEENARDTNFQVNNMTLELSASLSRTLNPPLADSSLLAMNASIDEGSSVHFPHTMSTVVDEVKMNNRHSAAAAATTLDYSAILQKQIESRKVAQANVSEISKFWPKLHNEEESLLTHSELK